MVGMSELIRCLSNPALVVPRVVNLVTLFTGGFLLISLTVMALAEPSFSILFGSASLLRVLAAR